MGDNPLTEGSVETETRAKQLRTFVHRHLQDFLMSDEYHLFDDCNKNCPAGIARRLAMRIGQFMHPSCRKALIMYRTGITSEARWYWCERNEPSSGGRVRAPFDMVRDEKLFACMFRDEHIMGVGRSVLQKKGSGRRVVCCQHKQRRSCVVSQH